jgi:hypothetical protein
MSIKALKHALETLEEVQMAITTSSWMNRRIEELRAAIEQAEKQKPVAWMYEYGTDNGDAVNEVRWYPNVHWKKPTGLVRNVVPLYTAPPQHLLDEAREEGRKQERALWEMAKIGQEIEQALKDKNT